MKTRYFEDLNPGYPAKGEKRWVVMCRTGACLKVIYSEQFRTRRPAARRACILQVEHELATLGITVKGVEQ